MKLQRVTYLLLILISTFFCIGKGPGPERSTGINDELPGRFIRELGPEAVDALLNGPQSEPTLNPLPVNELLYLIDRVSTDKVIQLVQGLGEDTNNEAGAIKTLKLIDAIKQIGCTRANDYVSGAAFDPTVTTGTSSIAECNPDHYNYLNIIAQLVGGTSDTGLDNLVQVVNQNTLSTATAGDKDKFLLKMAYLVVAYDTPTTADPNLSSENLTGPQKLYELLNLVTDGRDVVYLVDSFDTNACPDVGGNCVDATTVTWQIIENDETQMAGLKNLMQIMPRITDGSKLASLINGPRSTKNDTSEDAAQQNYIDNKLKVLIEGPVPMTAAERIDWNNRLVALINGTNDGSKIAYVVINVNDVNLVMNLVQGLSDVDKMAQLINAAEDGANWPDQVNGPQIWGQGTNGPARPFSNDSAVPRLIQVLNGIVDDSANGLTTDSNNDPDFQKLLALIDGIDNMSKLTRLIQDVADISDMVWLINNLEGASGNSYDEPATVTITGSGSSATATPYIYDGRVVAIYVTSSGSGYDFSTTVTINGASTGSGATATASITNGAIRTIFVDNDLGKLSGVLNEVDLDNLSRLRQVVDGQRALNNAAGQSAYLSKLKDLIANLNLADEGPIKVKQLINGVSDAVKIVNLVNDVTTTANLSDIINGINKETLAAPRDTAVRSLVYMVENTSDASKLVTLIDGVTPASRITDLVNSVSCISQAADGSTNNSDCNTADGSRDDLDAAGKKLASLLDGVTDANDMVFLLDQNNVDIEQLKKLVNEMKITSSIKVANLINEITGTDCWQSAGCNATRGLTGGATGLGKMVNIVNFIPDIADVVYLIDNVDDGTKLGRLINSTEKSTNLVALINTVIEKFGPSGLSDSDKGMGELASLLNNLDIDTDMPKVPILLNSIKEAGEIFAITITEEGDCTVNPSVTLSGGDGSGLTINETFESRKLTGITITNNGSGYTTSPTLNIAGGTCSTTPAATISLITSKVAYVKVTNGGAGCTSAPTVNFTGGGGAGVAATAAVSGGQVSSISLTATGNGYTSAPAVSFTGGGGCTGVTAEAYLVPQASSDHDLIANLMRPFNSTTITAGGIGLNRLTSMIDSLHDASGGSCVSDCATAIGNMAALIKGVHSTINYRGGTIPRLEGFIRLLWPQADTTTDKYGFEYGVGATDFPGIGTVHVAHMLNLTSNTQQLITVMNGTNIEDVTTVVGCGDKVNDSNEDGTPDDPAGPDFHSPCTAIGQGW